MRPERTPDDPEIEEDEDDAQEGDRVRSREDRRRRAFLRHRLELASPRVGDQFRALLADFDPDRRDANLEAEALRVAELTVAAERLRLDLMADPDAKPDAKVITSVLRFEGTARRAKADFIKMFPKPVLTYWQQTQREEQREEKKAKRAELRKLRRQQKEEARNEAAT